MKAKIREKLLTFVKETGVPDSKKRCEAVTYKYGKEMIVARCRRDDTQEVRLGDHVVKLCCTHRKITLEEFEDGCRMYLQKKEKLGPVA